MTDNTLTFPPITNPVIDGFAVVDDFSGNPVSVHPSYDDAVIDAYHRCKEVESPRAYRVRPFRYTED